MRDMMRYQTANRSILKQKLIYFKPFLAGVATCVPGFHGWIRRGPGGTISARYCYSVWLRHLVMADTNGLPTQPEVVAELGPGGSLGIGLAALLSGTSKYYAFDITEYANRERNLQIFDDLVDLFRRREHIPDNQEFPEVKPDLNSYKFPVHILTEQRLNRALRDDRVQSIKDKIKHMGSHAGPVRDDDLQISYVVPWHDPNVINDNSVDMVFSQAVFEHVDDLEHTYRVLYRWLKSGGCMVNQIDFRSHGTAMTWDGHWAYSDFAWKVIRGRSLYLLNREPHSTHIRLLKTKNFDVVCDIRFRDIPTLRREQLARRFRDVPEDDLATSGAFIQAVKKP
jgi:hypothetical protein